MTKIALPALALLIFGLFYFSITSQPFDEPSDVAPAPARAEVVQPPAVAVTEKAAPDRVEQLAKSIDSVSADLKRLSNETKANTDKIAQAATVRSDQDSKSTSDKTAQNMAEQIDALRSEQAKSLQESKDSTEKAAQAIRQEFAASQAKLVAQAGDALKASTARSEALTQRVDAMKKDIDDVRKSIEDDRQNASNISPGLALVAALAALVLGPFVARQLTANQLAAAKRQADAEAAASPRSQAVRAAQSDPPLAPTTAAEMPHHDSPHHDAPPPDEEAGSHDDANAHQKAAPDPEKV